MSIRSAENQSIANSREIGATCGLHNLSRVLEIGAANNVNASYKPLSSKGKRSSSADSKKLDSTPVDELTKRMQNIFKQLTSPQWWDTLKATPEDERQHQNWIDSGANLVAFVEFKSNNLTVRFMGPEDYGDSVNLTYKEALGGPVHYSHITYAAICQDVNQHIANGVKKIKESRAVTGVKK